MNKYVTRGDLNEFVSREEIKRVLDDPISTWIERERLRIKVNDQKKTIRGFYASMVILLLFTIVLPRLAYKQGYSEGFRAGQLHTAIQFKQMIDSLK